MLKITIQPGAGEIRLRLEGRLAGPWVAELRQYWQSAVGENAAVVDLREVDFVDQDGQALLAEMYRRGVRLKASGPFIQNMVDEIAASDCATVEEAPPGRPDDFVSAPHSSNRDSRNAGRLNPGRLPPAL
jgi:hypothetical protein